LYDSQGDHLPGCLEKSGNSKWVKELRKSQGKSLASFAVSGVLKQCSTDVLK